MSASTPIDVTQHVGLACRFVARTLGWRSTHPDWDDAVQEAMIALIRAAHHFDPGRGRWVALASVAVRRHLTQWDLVRRRRGLTGLSDAPRTVRKHGRLWRPSVTSLDSDRGGPDADRSPYGREQTLHHALACADLDPAGLIEEGELCDELARAVDELPEKPRRAVRAVLRGGLVVDAAREMGVCRATASYWWQEGLRLLREQLK